jgi:hypothetical protein
MSAKILSNLASVSDMIGVLEGMSEGMDSDLYVEQLIQEAHKKVVDRFDEDAAATAATGRFTHMYEFGTAGITRGRPTHADPTAPDARLYTHKITGRGGNQNIWFDYRPALTRNPQPTTASTGVPSKYLRKLSKRKYIFWNKAPVMELGLEVEIKSNRGDKGLIFVPTPGENSPRQFVMFPTKGTANARPISATPGRNSAGSFRTFWLMWWNSSGAMLLEEEMREDVARDLMRASAEAEKRAKATAMTPVQTTSVTGTWKKAKAIGKKLVFKW